MSFTDKIKPKQEKSFVQRIADENPFYIYSSFNSYDKPVWYILKSDEKNIFKLKSLPKDEFVDIRDYGIVLSFGVGESPSQEIIKKITSEN